MQNAGDRHALFSPTRKGRVYLFIFTFSLFLNTEPFYGNIHLMNIPLNGLDNYHFEEGLTVVLLFCFYSGRIGLMGLCN